jgi:hypothetical protein
VIFEENESIFGFVCLKNLISRSINKDIFALRIFDKMRNYVINDCVKSGIKKINKLIIKHKVDFSTGIMA